MLGPNQTRWLEALRSGDYEQGQVRLERDGCFCCLGVAGRLFASNLRHIRDKEVYYGDSAHTACEGIVEALALKCRSGGTLMRNFDLLVDMNDRGYDFNYIADMVEKNPEAYFKESR